MTTRAAPTELEIQDWCRQYLAGVLRRPIAKIDPAAKFDSLGLDSAESVFLASALEDWIGVPLHAEAAMDHPNIAALSRFVHETIAANQGPATGR